MKVTINIPLKEADSEFQRYEVITIPRWIPTLKSYVRYETEEYFLISKNLNNYLSTNKGYLSSCQVSGTFTICPATIPLRGDKDESCEYSLFFSLSGERCEKEVIRDFKEYFKKVGDRWLFVVSGPTPIRVECPWGNSIRKLEGARYIAGVADCTIDSGRHKLIGTHEKKVEMQGQWDAAVIPRLEPEQMFSPIEKALVNRVSQNEAMLSEVAENVKQAEGNVRLKKVLGEVVEKATEPKWEWRDIHIHALSVAWLLGIAIMAGILYYLYKTVMRERKIPDMVISP